MLYPHMLPQMPQAMQQQLTTEHNSKPWWDGIIQMDETRFARADTGNSDEFQRVEPEPSGDPGNYLLSFTGLL